MSLKRGYRSLKFNCMQGRRNVKYSKMTIIINKLPAFRSATIDMEIDESSVTKRHSAKAKNIFKV